MIALGYLELKRIGRSGDWRWQTVLRGGKTLAVIEGWSR